jgi:hypothetical protein
MQERLQQLAEFWIGYKIRIIDFVGLTNDAMHVHASLFILLFSGLILRRRPDHILCWLIVLVAELFNEYADLKGLAPGEASIRASVHDLYNTMFWPSLMLVFGRILFPPYPAVSKAARAPSGDFADQPLEQPTPV